MKKLILICLVAMVSTTSLIAAPSDKVAEKVLKIFKESFPNVEKPMWAVYDSYYGVYFKNADNSSCRIYYDHEGRIIKTQRCYSASKLSPFISSRVNEKYPGMKIFGVTEVSSDEELAYHIILEDDKHFLYISSDATGNIKVEDKLKKTKE